MIRGSDQQESSLTGSPRVHWNPESALDSPVYSLSSVVHRVFPSLISVVGGELLLRIGSFLVVLLIARSYGPSNLGVFATALAYSTLVVTAAEGGLQASAVELIGRNPSHIQQVFSRLFVARSLVVLPLIAVTLAVCWPLRLTKETWIIAGLVGLRTLIQSYSQLLVAVLKSVRRMLVIGVVQGIHFLTLIGGIAAVHYYSGSLHLLLWILAGCQALELFLLAGFLRNAGLRFQHVALRDCWMLLRNATPIGLTNLLAAFIVRMDIIVLSLWVTATELGRFAAANAIVVVIYTSAWLFGSVLLPDFVRLVQDREALERYLHHWVRLVIWVAVPGSILLALLAPTLLKALYGEEFASSGLPGSIMVLAIPGIILNSLYTNKAISLRYPSVYLSTYVMTAFLALSLNLILGWGLGAVGIAISLVIREAVMLTIFRVRLNRADAVLGIRTR